MRSLLPFVLSAVLASCQKTASLVHDLTEENFGKAITSNDLVLAKFIKPECPDCESLSREFANAAAQLSKENVSFVQVDCAKDKKLCGSYNIHNTPSMLLFRALEHFSPYWGGNQTPAIVEYVLHKKKFPIISMLSKDSYEGFKAAASVTTIAYIAHNDKASNATYNAVAKRLQAAYIFGATSDPQLAAAEGVSQPSIVVFKHFDDGRTILNGTFSGGAIIDFVHAASLPLIGELKSDAVINYLYAQVPVAYIFVDGPEQRHLFATSLKPLAERYRQQLRFVTVDTRTYQDMATVFELPNDRFPALSVADPKADSFCPFKGNDLTAQTIADHVQGCLERKSAPGKKSGGHQKSSGSIAAIGSSTGQAKASKKSGTAQPARGTQASGVGDGHAEL